MDTGVFLPDLSVLHRGPALARFRLRPETARPRNKLSSLSGLQRIAENPLSITLKTAVIALAQKNLHDDT
ncbi:MAG TPA: hypothetical protein PLA90_00860, partial [Candidatus Sumerlaeota bacterium]|nr:hypothetical protein [Candidatus Sumerlaeota bacterium]